MPYDFSRFSAQSFERFAQALAAKTLGPGVSVFGAGPDGAREASFDGPLNLATHGSAWNGYVVVQAKYKTVAKGGVEDAAWLQKELILEFEKFLDPTRNLRKPEYYIIISNVVLSAVDGSSTRRGGQRKIEDLFEAYKDRLGLRGWLVWHPDVISAMLDADQEIRTRYAAWITEGDVLASALSHFRRPSISSVVPLALRRDLRKDRDIRRKDAGQITNNRIYLEDVFVDLPLEKQVTARHLRPPRDEDDVSSLDPDEHSERESEKSENDPPINPAGVVARLIERCADKLDPNSLKQPKRRARARPLPNRIVLLGGPGQGKSTITQFLAQISRARVTIDALRNEPPDTALETAEAVLSRAQQEGINLHGPARFPMHIELPKFADAIKVVSDRGEKLSLLRHCSNLLGKESDRSLQPEDLRGWLGDYPWLVILDGLDEVPGTGNRSDVVLAINEFLDDVNQAQGDVLILITTRPQGYGDDFPRRHWEHWSMANLSPDDAMRFASRLSDALLSDSSRQDEILAELKRASEDPATSPILISPLQVSILFSLVETRGGVPADRWSLFQRHYVLLRDREAAKEGETAKLLRDYTSQIDQIHYDAGFLLHVRAEASGSAHAFLTEAEFDLLIDHQLVSEGHSRESIDAVKRRLVTIATDRLVLLRSKTGGQIAFDVRSLQEFMAAARIMSSPEASIVDRLSEISARTHWRHVFRIAASKVFALTDLTHLRRQIIHICDALDRGDLGPSDMIALSGARLAIDLLTDNVAARLPDMRRALITRSMDLLTLGPGEIDSKFINFLDDDTKQTFEAKIVEHLSYDKSYRSSAAFGLLIQIANGHASYAAWANELLAKWWPSTPTDVLHLLQQADELPIDQSQRAKIFEAQLATSPQESIQLYYHLEGPESPEEHPLISLTPAFNWLASFLFAEGTSTVVRVVTTGGRKLFTTSARLVSGGKSITLPQWLDECPQWSVLRKAAEFTISPNKASLAALIRSIKVPAEWLSHVSLPWPAELVLEQVQNYEDLSNAANAIEQGILGDRDAWIELEQHWVTDGVKYSEVQAWFRLAAGELKLIGSPDIQRHSLRTRSDETPEDTVRALVDLLQLSTSKERSAWLCQRLVFFIRRKACGSSEHLAIECLFSNKALDCVEDRDFVHLALLSSGFDSSSVLTKLDGIGRRNGLRIASEGATAALTQAFLENRELRGLLALLLPFQRSSLTKQVAEQLDRIPPNELAPHPSDTPMIVASIAMIRILRGSEPDCNLPQALNEIVGALGELPYRIVAFARLVHSSPRLSHADSISILTMLGKAFKAPDRPIFTGLVDILKSKLDTRSSNFDDSKVDARLALPELAWLKP